ncbi:MAG: TIM barrel protein, partial [Chloroflexota bacterium]
MNHSVGLYEKAFPEAWSWSRKLSAAGEIGFDFLEISVDPTPKRLGRLAWSAARRNEVRRAIADSGVPIFNIVLSAHRSWPFGSRLASTRRQAREIAQKAVDLAASLN